MASNSERRALVEARALRHDAGLTPDQPADLKLLSNVAGAEVVRLSAGEYDDVEGAFLRRNGRPFILLNTSKSGRRQRFTHAHELGHARLLPENQDAELVDTGDELDSTRTSSLDEREANQFAAELLMPEAGVRALLRGGMRVENAVGLISRTYIVSPKSAAIRLHALSLIDEARKQTVLQTIEDDWKGFWSRQKIPPDYRAADQTRLPKAFLERAKALRQASVISDERYAELIERPLDVTA